jgi:hypothetical protein
MVKIGIIGSNNLFITREITDFIFKIKQNIQIGAIIYSGGNKVGVEADVKTAALKFGLEYREFNPSFTGQNEYSQMPAEYYGKPYHFSHFHDRYNHIVWAVDKLFIYMTKNDEKFFDPIIKKAAKKGVDLIIIK